MSYLVCHVQKFKASDVKGMQIHNQRESLNSKNKDIDHSKTELNYDLHNQQNINYNHKVKEIIKEGYTVEKAIRKDAVVMTSTLITSDGEFFNKLAPQEQKKFFESAYNKLKELYGEKNIVSAVVHMDETTPHMHLCSIPLTEQGKLSAKDLFNRRNLLSLQKELPIHLQSNGFEIQKGEGGGKHIEINEFKEQTLKSKSKELDNKLSYIEQKQDEVKNLEKVLDNTKSTLRKDLEPMQALQSNLEELNNLKAKKNVLGGKMNVSEGDYNEILGLAKKGLVNSIELKDLKGEIENLKIENKEYKRAFSSRGDEFEDYKKLKALNNTSNNKLTAINKVLRVMEPEEREQFLKIYNKKLEEIQKPQQVNQKAKIKDFQL